MLEIQPIKDRLAKEWIPAGKKERLVIANSICNDLAWELDLSKIPYNSTGDRNADKEDWQWLTKSGCDRLVKSKEKDEAE